MIISVRANRLFYQFVNLKAIPTKQFKRLYDNLAIRVNVLSGFIRETKTHGYSVLYCSDKQENKHSKTLSTSKC